MDKATSSSGSVGEASVRNPMEQLTKDEILTKYKSLLVIAKKAKQAKDELVEENRKLQDALASSETQKTADKQALMTMKEMLEGFTEAKLQLSTQLAEVESKRRKDDETLLLVRIENEALQRQVDRLTKDNEDLLTEMDSMENQLKQVNLLGKEQKNHLELLELEVNKMKESECLIASLQNCVSVAQAENKALKIAEQGTSKDLHELTEKYQRVKEVNAEQRRKFNALKDRFVDVHRRLKKLKECKRILLETQHEYADAVSQWQGEIIAASNQLCAQLNTLKAENEELLRKLAGQDGVSARLDTSSLLVKLEELERLSVDAMQQHNDKCAKLEVFREENKSLQHRLGEMKAQQVETDQQTSSFELISLKEQLVECQQSYDDLLTRQEQKEREHTDLLGEMRELNEALKARGDVISRQQERHQELSAEMKVNTSRLQQIEQSLSDKEQSLAVKDTQLFAIKREIENARQKVAELEGNCTRGEEQIRALSEELQGIRQAGLATMDTQSDLLSTSTISRAEESNRMRELDESFEEKYNKLRALAVKLKKKLQEQTAQLEAMQQQQNLSQTTVLLQEELAKCRQQLELLQQEKEESKHQIDALKAELQKLKSSRKQLNVMNLEIEAAEKSLGEASMKLTAKIEELCTLKATLSSKESSIVQLRKEIGLLETAKQAECDHAMELKEQVDRTQQLLTDAVHGKQQALLSRKEIELVLQSQRLELEAARLQLSQSASKEANALSAVLSERSASEDKLQASEEALRDAQRRLAISECTLDSMRAEFLDYKLKAQTVLRQNQSKDTTKERELTEALRNAEAQLQANTTLQVQQLAETDHRLAMQRENAETLQRRSEELLRVVEELRLQNEHMAHEQQAQMRAQQETLRQHRQQLEHLDVCHKEQQRQLENSHRAQVDRLQSELSRAARLPPSVGAVASAKMRAAIGDGSHTTADQQSKIDFLLMEREDAEGSEEAEVALNSAAAKRKISNATPRTHHDFMPLEELLNAPMQAINEAAVITTLASGSLSISGESGLAENAIVELQSTKERLQQQESRVRHLTTLLTENELDLAKLTQMNDMLKEELRRQERSEEREKHMHNSEYLKNVVVKFLTLNSGDERLRLVPVLNTILKLSRSETEMLQCAAKGLKVSTDGARGGWSNFLGGWGNNNNN